MKKKLTVLLLVLAAAAAGVFALTPRPMFPDAEDCTLHRVIFRTGDEEVDMTANVDMEELKGILARYGSSRLPTYFSPYQASDVRVEVDGISGGKPVHILIGSLNLVYESADKGGHVIRESDKLWSEISLFFGVG